MQVMELEEVISTIRHNDSETDKQRIERLELSVQQLKRRLHAIESKGQTE